MMNYQKHREQELIRQDTIEVLTAFILILSMLGFIFVIDSLYKLIVQ